MKVLYLTAHVLGDFGANAAQLFPMLSAVSPEIETTIVADFARNKAQIQKSQYARFLKLHDKGMRLTRQLRNAWRMSRTAKAEDIDVIHVFYRQRTIPLIIFLRLGLLLFRARARILVDHRSVNLARGPRAIAKKSANLLMQLFVHDLAGNPLAVKSNHPIRWRPSHIVDLGYDVLPEVGDAEIDQTKCNIWFVGSLGPRNRKSEFLIRVFDLVLQQMGRDAPLCIRVAGPARTDQVLAMKDNPLVEYLGVLPRHKLYQKLVQFRGIGLAFMNRQFHGQAPSLKFCEYAALGFHVIASDTEGLGVQAKRMGLETLARLPEEPEVWAQKIVEAATASLGPGPNWVARDDWSYASIHARQVVPLYRSITA